MNMKLGVAFEVQRCPFLTGLVLGSSLAGPRYWCSAQTEKLRLKINQHAIYPLQTSPTPPLLRAAHSDKSTLTAYSLGQPGVQCSMLHDVLPFVHSASFGMICKHQPCASTLYQKCRHSTRQCCWEWWRVAITRALRSCTVMKHSAILTSLVWEKWISTHYTLHDFSPSAGLVFFLLSALNTIFIHLRQTNTPSAQLPYILKTKGGSVFIPVLGRQTIQLKNKHSQFRD